MRLIIEFVDSDEIRKSFENADEIVKEGGWWFDNGTIVVLKSGDKVRDYGVALHEFVEFVLEKEFGFAHPVAHDVANILEGKFRIILGGASDE